MFARLCVPLAFGVVVRPDDILEPITVERDGYRFEVNPPYKSGLSPGDGDFAAGIPPLDYIDRLPPAVNPPLRVHLDEQPAVVADAIYVDIHGEALSRAATPPGTIGVDQETVVPLAINVVNEVLGRFRALGENSPVVEVAEEVPHVLIYLDDSGEEFESDSSGQSVRRRIKARITVPSLLLLTPDLWSAGRELPADFVDPAWEVLLSEARRLLPEVGLPLVLAYSAVEIRLDNALENLAEQSGGVTSSLVIWLMETRSPSLPIQASDLLALLGADSLKSDNILWGRFQRLRKARNSFVHDGQAHIDGEPVTQAEIGDLLVTARDVIDWLDNQLGYERPRYTGKATLHIPLPLTANQTDDPPPIPDCNEGDAPLAGRTGSDSE